MDIATTRQPPVDDIAVDATSADGSPAPCPPSAGSGAASHSPASHTAGVKLVPESASVREEIRTAAERFARTLDRSRPFGRHELERAGRQLLAHLNQPESYLGFTMVLVGNVFWKQQFLATPYHRRLLVLPHCVNSDLKSHAEQLGYTVLLADGSPLVLQTIVDGAIDGVLGVACLDVLEKAIDTVLAAGVPSYAIPLHSGDCSAAAFDEAWVWDVLDKYEPLDQPRTRSYVPIMRAANRLFTRDFDRLLPRYRSTPADRARSPLGLTEDVSYDWLANGGKRFRPFITLAAYDAITGGQLTRSGAVGESGSNHDAGLPAVSDAVARVAMAIEAFHKASLVHDDIQDDDLFRYGRETLHRSHGLGPAINIGDYLIGLGYRLVNSCRGDLGTDVACDILDSMAEAHIKLCDGQGAEMAWQNTPDWDFTPVDALTIYGLKTSPAFEAALFAGLRMGGPVTAYRDLVPQFCRQIGVGFQILNDLKDWRGDQNNKLVAGQDALALRPTVLLSLALQGATSERRRQLREIFEGDDPSEVRLQRLRAIFDESGAFTEAETLVEKSRARAEALAESVDPPALRQLLNFFIETVLAEEADATRLTARLAPRPELVTAS